MNKKLGKGRAALIVGGAAIAALTPLLTTEIVAEAPMIGLSYGAVVMASAPMAFSKRLSLQLTARSIWWATGLYGALGAVMTTMYLGFGWTAGLFLAILGGSAAALLAAGRSGLSQASGFFAPKIARTTLMTSIILALADTQALLFYGLLSVEGSDWGAAAKFGLAGAAMLVSLFGLYRLKVWGLFATVAANITIAALAITGVLALPKVLAGALVATAIVQLLLPIPLLRKVLAGARESDGTTSSTATSQTRSLTRARSEDVVFGDFERAEARETVGQRARA